MSFSPIHIVGAGMAGSEAAWQAVQAGVRVVLHEMLTGRQLFEGDDVTEVLASVVKDQPDLSQVPFQVRRLLAAFSPAGHVTGATASSASHLVKDPVCGTYVPEGTALQAGDQFFCSEDCRNKWVTTRL